jgi:hypothetical protein
MNRPNSRSNEKLTWVMRIVLVLLGRAGMSDGRGANIAVRREEPAVTRRLGHQQLGCECLPGSDQLWPDGIVRVPWYRPELVEALP